MYDIQSFIHLFSTPPPLLSPPQLLNHSLLVHSFHRSIIHFPAYRFAWSIILFFNPTAYSIFDNLVHLLIKSVLFSFPSFDHLFRVLTASFAWSLISAINLIIHLSPYLTNFVDEFLLTDFSLFVWLSASIFFFFNSPTFFCWNLYLCSKLYVTFFFLRFIVLCASLIFNQNFSLSKIHLNFMLIKNKVSLAWKSSGQFFEVYKLYYSTIQICGGSYWKMSQVHRLKLFLRLYLNYFKWKTF